MKKIAIGSIAALSLYSAMVFADNVINDDLIVTFSTCTGNDCVNGESFGFDTLRLKENNLRIHFQDTSNSASFPSNDWRIVANDSSNGGANYLAIEDSSAGRIPFRVEAGAAANSLVVEADGDVGIGTLDPVVNIHTVDGNTPTLRIEQDGSSGFTPQTWDVAGNETNFFVRDATNGSSLPFRIRPGNGNDNALYIDSDGDIGLGDTSPDSPLHITDNVGSLETMITVENTNGTTGFIRGMKFINNGGTILSFQNTSPGAGLPSEWNIQARHDDGTLSMANAVGSGTEFSLSHDGNLTISGDLTANGTTYTSSFVSKENFTSINVSNILSAVANLSISKWNYKRNDDSVQHIGPMAEEFHKVFGLNGNATDRISISDISGVALASIQALKQESDAKDKKIETLEKELAELKVLVHQLANK